MDLIEDSLMNEADWLCDHNIGLENTLWDSLSDKGSNSSDASSGFSDCSKQYDPCDGLSLDDFLPPLAQSTTNTATAAKNTAIIKKVKREKKIITSNPNVKIIKIEADQDGYEENCIESRLGAITESATRPNETITNSRMKRSHACDSAIKVEHERKNDIIEQAMTSSLTGAELKAYKRHQRMIRNRESASLSRQRRKAHLEQIELRNRQLEKENKLLQQQVRQMRAQLAGYHQTVYVEVPTLTTATLTTN